MPKVPGHVIMSHRTGQDVLAGTLVPSISLQEASSAAATRKINRDEGSCGALDKPIMPESLAVDTARRKSSVGEEWSERLLSSSPRSGSWCASLESVTVRPVSPKILSLCSKFVSIGDASDSGSSSDQLAINNSRPRSKSVTLASRTDESVDPSETPLSSLFRRRSISPKPLRINLAPPDIYSLDPDGSGPLTKQLLSPSTSPSSGYGSGINSSSPVWSPRSHSPTQETQMHREQTEIRPLLSVAAPEQVRSGRSLSHDSGVARLSVESPSAAGRSSSEDEPCPVSHSRVRSMHVDCGGNFTIQVPKPVRPQLVKSKPVFHLYPPGSPSSLQPELLSPDEGFQDLKVPQEPSPATLSHAPTSPTPQSPGHGEIKRTELTVRLNPPGSPLPPLVHETSPGLHRRFSSQCMDESPLGSLDEDINKGFFVPLLSSATSIEEQSVPSSELKPCKQEAAPPALVIDLCDSPHRSEQASPVGAFSSPSNSGTNSSKSYQYLTLSEIQSNVGPRKLSTDSSISSFSQGSIEEELEEIHASLHSSQAPTSAKPPLTAAAKRAQFSSVSTRDFIDLPCILTLMS